MGWAYYNENAPEACAWLAELMAAGAIAEGCVDGRSITDVQPEDLIGFTQCHFFAGIGGWPYALRLAGVPDDEPVWTGSCPCQPFSVAGKQKGEADVRHLWPDFRRLITIGRPSRLFGEQVASKAGRVWLAGVRADLEALGYAVGSADLCAAGVGAPHIRQRLYWLGIPKFARLERHHGDGPDGGESRRLRQDAVRPAWEASVFIPCADGKSRRVPTNEAAEPEPALFPLAHGVSNRVGLLRGSGNAICPELAAEFVKASEEAIEIFRVLT